MARALAWLQRTRGWRRPGPLAVALLAALIAHVLILALGQLRRVKALPQAPTAAATAPDDTPELLRFSRRSALPPSFSTLPVPMPPPAVLPPPPPASTAGDAATSPGAATAAATRGHRQRGRATPLAQGSTARGSRRGAPGSGGSRNPGRRSVAPAPVAASADPTASPGPERLAEARASLETLQSGSTTEARLSAQTLWQQATPQGEAGLGEGQELRRLPADAVRTLGVAPGTRLILRGDDGRTLVLWLEGDLAWLLRGPAAGRGDDDTAAGAG